MTARRQSTAATGERVLDAAVELFWYPPTDQIALEEVAGRAGVTVQTVIRRFGSKDGLIAAAADREYQQVVQQRDRATAGDVGRPTPLTVPHRASFLLQRDLSALLS